MTEARLASELGQTPTREAVRRLVAEGAMTPGHRHGYEELMTTKRTLMPPSRVRTEDPNHQQWYGKAVGQVAAARAATFGLIDGSEWLALQSDPAWAA
ncbi:MAG TPA: hypothetical protein VJT49_12160 [Amycolatopsis sp.]|uniref:hypothetical protein n=1 Tax=Amycolatopsis sp. TaxID=37632 RepID=UPI002B49F101|nr:hypothetical protein [Amycolatopsis sp.]HKS45840.1 hypothetical protein [Amycolatopsis sp.]